MMKTVYLYSILAGLLMITTAIGCSGNEDPGLRPNQKTLELKVDGKDAAFTLNLGAQQDTYEIDVESNTLWRVEAVSDGGWISLDKVSGKGNESFSFSIRDNMLAERTGSITVAMIDAQGEPLSGVSGSSLTITIRQAMSNVRLSPSSLEPFKATGNARQLFRVTANVTWNLEVVYDGDRNSDYLTIERESGDMSADGKGGFTGSGEAAFYMSIADNRTASERIAYLNLKSDAGEYSVEIRQVKSEYTFDVSPITTQVVNPQGTAIEFGVYSLSDWYIQSADPLDDWITFSATQGKASENRVTTVATVKPNTTRSQRTAHLEFKAVEAQYGVLTVDIVQEAFAMTFAVSPQDLADVVMEEGGSYSVSVSSTFNWQIAKTPGWISVTPGHGEPSVDAKTLDVRIDRNAANMQREDVITVIPLKTEFHEGVQIDPETVGVKPLTIPVVQYGGQKPAISVPWVSDGIRQKEATLIFNYYSPFTAINEAGLEWRMAGETAWNSLPVPISDGKSGTVTAKLTGLQAATDYEARGYVIVGTEKFTGSATEAFTTAGSYPGSDDNPIPSR